MIEQFRKVFFVSSRFFNQPKRKMRDRNRFIIYWGRILLARKKGKIPFDYAAKRTQHIQYLSNEKPRNQTIKLNKYIN